MFVLKDHDLWAKFKDHTDKVVAANSPQPHTPKKYAPATVVQHCERFDEVSPADWPYKYFTPVEVACKGTGLVPIHSANFRYTMERLDLLRELDGNPMFLTSMYRSPQWNKQVGGGPRSYHMQGMAADIVLGGRSHERLARMAADIGFNGIGEYPKNGFIHIDTRVRSATWKG